MFLLGGVVFEYGNIIWLKAELWAKDYEHLDLPTRICDYKLKVEITKRFTDGAYNIFFYVDETRLMVYPQFFENALLTEEEASTRIELDAETVEDCQPSDDISEENEEDITSTQVTSNAKKVAPTRVRVRKSAQKVDSDASDVEEVAEDILEMEGDQDEGKEESDKDDK